MGERRESSHIETPLMAQHRNMPWSTASSSDLTAVGRNSHEKTTLGSPLLLSRSDEESLFQPSTPGRRNSSWLHRGLKLAALIVLVFACHLLLDGRSSPHAISVDGKI